MAISDQKPKSEKPKSEKPKSGRGGKAEQEAAWTLNEETGRRERAGRALPYEKKLREILIGVSGGILMLGDEFTSNAVTAKADELAYGYARLAQEDERVRKVVEALTSGSAWTEALFPTVSLVVVVAWHHGLAPDRIGVPLTIMSGLTPVSREGEVEARERMARAAAAEADASGPGPSEGNGNAGRS